MNRRTLALGRLKAGTKNKTEAEYGKVLELRRQAGQIETILSQAPIRLLDGEPALLLAAEMSPRGYHERVSYILARPALRQARALRPWAARAPPGPSTPASPRCTTPSPPWA